MSYLPFSAVATFNQLFSSVVSQDSSIYNHWGTCEKCKLLGPIWDVQNQKSWEWDTEICIWTTERLHFHFSLSCIGEGNGNPLQCSCLENLRDGGAWWAAIYGVTQSRTWLKWLSSSSSWFFPQGLGPRVFLTQLLSDISLKIFSVAPTSLTSLFLFLPFHFMLFPFFCSLPGSIIIFLTHIYKSLSLYLVYLKWLLSVEKCRYEYDRKGDVSSTFTNVLMSSFQENFHWNPILSLASCVTLSYFAVLSISFSVFSMGTIITLISEISLLNKILHMKYLA